MPAQPLSPTLTYKSPALPAPPPVSPQRPHNPPLPAPSPSNDQQSIPQPCWGPPGRAPRTRSRCPPTRSAAFTSGWTGSRSAVPSATWPGTSATAVREARPEAGRDVAGQTRWPGQGRCLAKCPSFPGSPQSAEGPRTGVRSAPEGMRTTRARWGHRRPRRRRRVAAERGRVVHSAQLLGSSPPPSGIPSGGLCKLEVPSSTSEPSLVSTPLPLEHPHLSSSTSGPWRLRMEVDRGS